MSTREDYGNVNVCQDCYFAHHYGAHEHDGQYYAGDTDSPADRKPLALLDGHELADNVSDESGQTTFSWSSCDGCGSTLGGSRYRLAVWE